MTKTSAATSLFSMRPVDLRRDVPLIHGWVTQERARFWGMAEKSEDEVREVYAFLDSLDSHHAYLVRHLGVPVAIFQTYEPQHDPVGELYDVQEGDLGVHVLVAEGSRVPGFTGGLLAFALGEVLADPAVRRIVGEPDVLNDKSRARALSLGAEEGPEIDLGWKRAQLLFLPRQTALALSGGSSTE
ncbi:hypothetical protein ASD11_13510 [Aeromicrobium sp. Root495]|uniref:GNAT family N-acetyltransferase n=1 Tax=Aeromicrobium sp. Root495 TaxID=1736550 RepID=UPI000700F0CB|nr:GNAT family N-acetyltransferase [Aeromicrobium sp. Root495]KQY60457.1 hypothetical protein ASD11_13510 [Aeromicrobium sp. Root495]